MSLFDFSTQKLGSAHRCSVSAGKSEIVQTAKNSFKRMQTLKLLLVPVQSDIGNICSFHRRPVAYGEIIIFTGSHNNSPMFTTPTPPGRTTKKLTNLLQLPCPVQVKQEQKKPLEEIKFTGFYFWPSSAFHLSLSKRSDFFKQQSPNISTTKNLQENVLCRVMLVIYAEWRWWYMLSGIGDICIVTLVIYA